MEKQSLQRYACPDKYTLLEIGWNLKNPSCSEKIEFLDSVYNNGLRDTQEIGATEKIATTILNSGDPIAKKWLASGKLPSHYLDLIASSEDIYIKAIALENSFESHLYGQPFQDLWKIYNGDYDDNAEILWLAAMRSEHFSMDDHSIIEDLFNFNDTKLKISLEQRTALIRAFLTNEKRIKESHFGFVSEHFEVGHEAHFTLKPYRKIWELISQWPDGDADDSGVCPYRCLKFDVYKHVGFTLPSNEISKTGIYKNSPEIEGVYPSLKLAIIKNDLSDMEILRLASLEKEDSTAKNFAIEQLEKISGKSE